MPRTMQLKIRGLPETIRALKRVPVTTRQGAVDGLNAGGLIVLNAAKESIINGPKTGHISRRYRPFRIHQASAPGEAPANDTGELVRSLFMRVDRKSMSAYVSASAPYAKWLEYGTRLMLARPFLRPALAKTRTLVKNVIADFIRRALKK